MDTGFFRLSTIKFSSTKHVDLGSDCQIAGRSGEGTRQSTWPRGMYGKPQKMFPNRLTIPLRYVQLRLNLSKNIISEQATRYPAYITHNLPGIRLYTTLSVYVYVIVVRLIKI